MSPAPIPAAVMAVRAALKIGGDGRLQLSTADFDRLGGALVTLEGKSNRETAAVHLVALITAFQKDARELTSVAVSQLITLLVHLCGLGGAKALVKKAGGSWAAPATPVKGGGWGAKR